MKSQVKISRRRLLAMLGTTGGAVTVGAADLGRIAARQREEGAADTAESDSLRDGFVRAPSLDTRLTRNRQIHRDVRARPQQRFHRRV
jgi:hypothetical protein